jgi:osmotically-inducible protein OsmY
MPTARSSCFAARAVIEFLFDPRSGRRRRHLLQDRTRAALRNRARRVERHARYESGKLHGVAHSISHRTEQAREFDDIGLVQKVESELFRDRSIPKGQISINADRSIVVLRGELGDPVQIERIEQAVRRITGVREVENLLHLPGVAAPASRPHPRAQPFASVNGK